MTDAQDFATYLERAIKAVDMSATDLARAMGVSDSVISKWLRGTIPSIPNLRLLAPVLKVPARDLIVVAGHLTPEEAGMKEIPEPPNPPTVEEEIMAQEWLSDEAKNAMVTMLGELRAGSSRQPKPSGSDEQNRQNKRKRGA